MIREDWTGERRVGEILGDLLVALRSLLRLHRLGSKLEVGDWLLVFAVMTSPLLDHLAVADLFYEEARAVVYWHHYLNLHRT